MSHNPTDGYRPIHNENLNKMPIMFEGMEEMDKNIPPFDSTNFNTLINWIQTANIVQRREVTNEPNQINWQKKIDNVKRIQI
jgi:hypothetical protein